MASLQLLKSPLSLSSSQPSSCDPKISCPWSGFSSTASGKMVVLLRFRSNRRKSFLHRRKSFRLYSKVEENDSQSNNGEEPPESLFMKELKRRGMTSLIEESSRNAFLGDEDSKLKEEDGGFSTRNAAISTDYGRSLSNQREQSMALNSEGLEGLIPRAKLLLTLGGTFFLAFGPLILITIASFSALYLYFGSSFVHDGSNTPISPPQYIDPYALLEEERISQVAPRLN